MAPKRSDEFRREAVHIALTSEQKILINPYGEESEHCEDLSK